MTSLSILSRIADELSAHTQQVTAAVNLLDQGATVPFIARYRKEITGSLTDTQLRTLESRLYYLRELEERRATILSSIEQQGKLSDALKAQLLEADTKTRLEDLYLPYKPKRRTKGQIAIEAGLQPLADQLWHEEVTCPASIAQSFINPDQGIADTQAALEGAKYILMERFAEDASLLERLRELLYTQGYVIASKLPTQDGSEGDKFRDYFDHKEPLRTLPSHRMLAMLRGRSAGVLQLSLALPQSDGDYGTLACESLITDHLRLTPHHPSIDAWRQEVVRWTWKVKLYSAMETDLLAQQRERAETEAIEVFANNLQNLLLAAPAGQRVTLGLDPGYRTGVKLVVIDGTGKYICHDTLYPHEPHKRRQAALETLEKLCRQHRVELIAIGNGTASRETDELVSQLMRDCPQLALTKVVVSEAGASVYSASERAAEEFPQLDVTIRGAISIARRLQDPLAELVKIDPKAIGVGQYQHDVSQVKLTRSLQSCIEDCVNRVGVDLNTASSALLAYVAGLSTSIAQNIVAYRDQHGAFDNRQQLLNVSRLGPKAFEQAAGFLRIAQGSQPLDNSAVHPEAYAVVEHISQQQAKPVQQLIGNSTLLRQLNAADYMTEQFGLPTIEDILQELDKPGRDPRPEFRTARFSDTLHRLEDLTLNYVTEGVVTNVTNFGAFIDIGVHQDGLVHISAMSQKYIDDPHKVVKAGDIVQVKVIAIDIPRKRIGLSMRLSDTADQSAPAQETRSGRNPAQRARSAQAAPLESALAQQLKKALKPAN